MINKKFKKNRYFQNIKLFEKKVCKYLLAGLGNGDGILQRVKAGGLHEGSLEGEHSFPENRHIRDAVVDDFRPEDPVLSLLLSVPFQEFLAVLGLHQVWLEPEILLI